MMRYLLGLAIFGASGLAVVGLYTLVQKKTAEAEGYDSLIRDGILSDPCPDSDDSEETNED